MRHVFCGLTLAAGLLLPSLAAAAPDHYADDGSLFASLFTEVDSASHKSTYKFTVGAYVLGDKKIGAQDAIQVDWKQNGKTLATQRCPLTPDSSGDGKDAYVECTLEKATLTASGDVVADVSYVDDRAETTTLLRTLKLNIGRYYLWNGMNGKKPIYDTYFQITGNDLLGATFARKNAGSFVDSLRIRTWMSRNTNDKLLDTVLRCSVDGQKLDADVLVPRTESRSDLVAGRSRAYVNGTGEDEVVRGWAIMELMPRLYFGPQKADARPEDVYLSSHPGKWACEWRDKGVTLRQFYFTVDAKGELVAHPEQQGWALQPGTVFVDTGFSKAAWDMVFDPKAVKASVLYGRAWAKPDLLEGLKSLPPAKDVAVPKPPKGVK